MLFNTLGPNAIILMTDRIVRLILCKLKFGKKWSTQNIVKLKKKIILLCIGNLKLKCFSLLCIKTRIMVLFIILTVWTKIVHLLAVRTTIVLTTIGVDYTLKMWKRINLPVFCPSKTLSLAWSEVQKEGVWDRLFLCLLTPKNELYIGISATFKDHALLTE